MIVVVDYGVGNLGSIFNMLRRVGGQAIISSRAEDVRVAEKLILPGVGSFDNAMARLQESGLVPVLAERVLGDGTPILGICLGMQLLTKGSEEGRLPGLGWVDAETRRFSFDPATAGLKIPHMGWNSVEFVAPDVLCKGFADTPRFYFAHSYHVVCENPKEGIGQAWYGYDFTAVLRKDNIRGTQFHPEKSHRFGMTILRNFVECV